MTNIHEVEKKWQREWEDSKVFEAEVEKDKDKYFVTFPYPYINLSPHVGHAYSILRTDMMSRFYMMLGYNSLFPMGFHATGEPIVGAAKRVKKGDESQINSLKKIGIKEEAVKKFKNPEYIIKYFINEWKKDLKDFGLSIDWRRSFHTTKLNPEYNKFVTWQFLKLREMGLVKKGTHPVIFCPECESPSGSHDRKEGENATIEEYVLLKFEFGDEFLVAATLRPETVYGQTNLWVHPDIMYVRAEVDDEVWIISEECAEKLGWQKDDVEIIGKVKGEDLISKYCKAPMIGKEIIILPSFHCEAGVGTGIVTSVPSDAPFDWISLKILQESKEACEKYGLDYDEVRSIEVIPIIKTPELGDKAGVKVCEERGISTLDKNKLEKATKHVYKIGFHKGVMNNNCGEYAGKKVRDVKDDVKEEMVEKGEASLLYEMSEPVICRCLTPAVVKIIKDQWFIAYSDEDWKKKALKCLEDMTVYPGEAVNVMRNMINNLKDKACARKSGLGTPLPWAPEYTIECLSDSTIYMSYYIISKYVNHGDISSENMSPEFFNYVLLGEGSVKEVSEKTKVSADLLKKVRDEFLYFYPVDLRNSGKDLLTNHLVFFIYNHVAFWDEEFWPRAIGANGWVTLDGMKMSKSKGNFVSLREAINKYGCDATRLAFFDTAEGIDDADFQTKSAENFKRKLEALIERVKDLESVEGEKDVFDKWLYSRIQKRIKKTNSLLKNMLNRSALKHSFHGLLKNINVYLSHKKVPNKETINYAYSVFSRINVPFIPHTCEEINAVLGEDNLVHELEYPEYDENRVDEESEFFVELYNNVVRDTNNIIKLVGKEPEKIKIFVSEKWKHSLFKELKNIMKKEKEFNKILKEVMKKDEFKKHGKSTVGIVEIVVKDVGKIPDKIYSQNKELSALRNMNEFFRKKFNCEISIIKSEDSSNNKSKNALPNKPGIFIE